MSQSLFTKVSVVELLLVVFLYLSSLVIAAGLIYGCFFLLVKNKKDKSDFDHIDSRNQTRYLRYHYPDDKR